MLRLLELLKILGIDDESEFIFDLNNKFDGVEPSNDEPGLFWLDATGLERLHDSLAQWGRLIRADLARESLEASVAVGYGRFGTYFKTTLSESQPLQLRYRLVVSEGEPPSVESIQSRYETFVDSL